MSELSEIQQVGKASLSPERHEGFEIHEKGGERLKHVFSRLRRSKENPDAIEADYELCDEHGPLVVPQTVLIDAAVSQEKEFTWRDKEKHIAAGVGIVAAAVVVGGIYVRYRNKSQNS